MGWNMNTSQPTIASMEETVHTIFVWDFDWTVINCNSDEYIPGQFMEEADVNDGFRELYQESRDWHACVQAMVGRAMKKQGATPDAILAAAEKMPYLKGVRSALDIIRTRKGTGQMILAAGNTLFIGAYLDANGLARHFTHGVISNEGKWVRQSGGKDVRLEVIHQSKQYGGHTCDRCSANLCKTQALEKVLEQHFPGIFNEQGDRQRPRIVYVGDGANDACPALCVLGESDLLLARAGRRRKKANTRAGPETDKEAITEREEGSPFGIVPALQCEQEGENKLGPKCRVWEWNTGDELKGLVTKIIENI